jgi:hypothetical protein
MTQAAEHLPLTTPSALDRLRWPALIVAIVGTIGCVVAFRADRHLFFRAYLFAFTFWLSLPLGSLALLMLHQMTGGYWGVPLARIARSAALTLPLMVFLFLPLFAGLGELYPWASGGPLAANDLHRVGYNNVPFFTVRFAVYFAIWIGLAYAIFWSKPATARKFSAIGIVLYGLTLTHAGTDWIMSRDTHFYSTMFPFILITGQCLAAIALLILMLMATNRLLGRGKLHPILLRDVGNILLTLVILWTYMSFFQLLVIWMGNLRDDNGWYTARGLGQPGPWRWVGATLLLVHFAIPFFLLLFRENKQHARVLAGIAATVLSIHLLEQYWLVAPSGHGAEPVFDPSWVDLVPALAIGGIWCGVFFHVLARTSLPMPDPIPEEMLHD